MKLAAALAVFLAALGYLGFKLLGPFGRSRQGASAARHARRARRADSPARLNGRD
jgi:hypothetical protein